MRLGKVAGIPIILSQNWLVFVAIIGIINLLTSGLMAAVNTLLVVGFVTGFIVLHELGHSLTALRFGAKTDVIGLHFFGGAAQISEAGWYKLIAKPFNAMLVWMAGPAVSIGLYFLLKVIARILPGAYLSTGAIYLANTNLVLAIFNLMPVFPLDGGGIFYCVLRFIFSKRVAIRITSVAGIIGSIIFILVAFKFRAIILGIIGVMALISSYNAPKHRFFIE